MSNKNLSLAKKSKNDEFYTMYSSIEEELVNYTSSFKDKIVYCNCDDYRVSNFVKWFKYNFKRLGLAGLIATNYNNGSGSYKYCYYGDREIKTPLKQNGDFRSPECIEILQEADIVVTNPPFSLFIPYVEQLIKYNKKFLIIGNKNAVTYKEVFPLIKDNKLWLGYTSPGDFIQPDGATPKSMKGLTRWFTNLETKKRTEDLLLFRKYNEKDYPKYDNYDAINVDKVKDIPMDYYGVMGVPITFLDSYNPNQFEIIGHPQSGILPDGWKGITKEFVDLYYNQGNTGSIREGWINPAYINHLGDAIVPYQRVLIKRK